METEYRPIEDADMATHHPLLVVRVPYRSYWDWKRRRRWFWQFWRERPEDVYIFQLQVCMAGALSVAHGATDEVIITMTKEEGHFFLAQCPSLRNRGTLLGFTAEAEEFQLQIPRDQVQLPCY